MNDKGRSILFAIAGGYIAYIGVSLIKSSIVQRPDNYILFVCVGVLFLLFGLVAVYSYIRRYLNFEKKEQKKEEILEEQELPITEAAIKEEVVEEVAEEIKETKEIEEIEETKEIKDADKVEEKKNDGIIELSAWKSANEEKKDEE